MNAVETRNLALLVALFGLLASCSRVQGLPEPPPTDEQRRVADNPAAQERRRDHRYLEARAAAIALYADLAKGRWEPATRHLAAETRRWLARYAGTDAVDYLREETDAAIDLLVGGRPRRLEDLREERESPSREVISNVTDAEHPRRLVFVKRDRRWKLLREEAPDE